MKLVILISGKKRSGKNFVGEVLQKYCNSLGYNTKQMSFADPLKKIVQETFMISPENLEKFKNDPEEYPVILPEDERTIRISSYREILQRLGSEGIRGVLGNDIWKNHLYNRICASTADVFIVTDFRFRNEAIPSEYYQLLKLKTLYVANDNVSKDSHQSENGIPDDYTFTCSIDNTGYASEESIIEQIKSANLISF